MRDAADATGPEEGAFAVVSRARLYSCLVTRPTGRAVRLSIEDQLADHQGSVVSVLDFRNVSVIDFSCADEVAAKLVRAAAGSDRGDLFLLFTGLEEHHLDPVESALRRRDLVVAAERADGSPLVLGELEEGARRAWHEVVRNGVGRPEGLVETLGLSSEAAEVLLEALHRRRLVLRDEEDYVSLRRAAAAAREDA